MLIRFFFIFLSMGLIFSACVDFAPDQPALPVARGPVVLKSPVSPVQIPAPLDRAACLEILSQFGGIQGITAQEKSVSLVMKSSPALSDEQIPQWITSLGEEIFERNNCPFSFLSFAMPREDGKLLRLKFFRENHDLYRLQQISLPEFIRRLEWEEVATLPSVKAQLKRARETGQHEDALKLLTTWSTLAPEEPMLHVLRGNVYLDEQDYPHAIESYEKALTFLPGDATVRFNLAVAKKELGRFSEALVMFEKLEIEFQERAESETERLQLKLQMADSCLRNNEPSRVESVLAGLTGPEVEGFYLEILRAQKKFSEAKVKLDAYLLVHPEDSLARYNLVLLSLDLHDEASARTAFADLQKVDEKLARELEFLEFLKSDIGVVPVVDGNQRQELAEPIAPRDVPPVRKTKSAQSVVDLPYKPPSDEVLNSENATLDDFLQNAPTENSGDEVPLTVAKPFDWTTLPYLPFKHPPLKPLPDPGY